MAPPVVLIFGAGPNIGAHVAKAFAAKGYKVALTSRKTKDKSQDDDYLHVQSDLSVPGSVDGVFAKVQEALGSPSVVVYNGAAHTPSPPGDLLGLSVSDLARDLTINTTNALAAAHQATKSFEALPSNASKTFIYTGNRTNIEPIPPLLSLGIGKAATANVIAFAALAYEEKGFKFYYADERKADGAPAYSAIDGPAHGQFYTQLAESETQQPWLATFVKGQGYKDFSKL